MGHPESSTTLRYLPHVVLATIVVVLTPGVVVWALASSGTVAGFLPLLGIGLGISLIVTTLGRIAWQHHADSQDLLFSDLMIWGWVRRWRAERKLDGAMSLLGLGNREMRSRLDPGVRVDVLEDLASSLEARDPYLHGHSRRVARYAAMIAASMDLPDETVSKVRTAAAVHDVGKLETPLAVLNKPGHLTDEEFDVIKLHAPRGAEMVSNLGDTELTEMVAHHHERLDGTGYPSKLAGSEIPLGARIIAVADTFDALTSTRAYRPARRHKVALGILRAEAGTQLDPEAVDAFDRCYSGSFGGLTVWALFAGLPHRLWSTVEGQLQIASGTAMSKAMTIAATTAATGGFAITASHADPRDTNASPNDVRAATGQLKAATPDGEDLVHGWADAPADMGRYEAAQERSIRGRGIDPSSLSRGAGSAGDINGGPARTRPQADGATATTLPNTSYPVAAPSDTGEGSGDGGSGSVDGGYETNETGNSANAPGHDPSGPGNSENAPGHVEDGPGGPLTAPEDSDEASGSFGDEGSTKEPAAH